ncbi:hypothetical protein HDU93_000201 [Gonapodya sp. JEL0774]|nr:hypothetical protein HDU93_000201 [Gonapodya sp. JEL0774]
MTSPTPPTRTWTEWAWGTPSSPGSSPSPKSPSPIQSPVLSTSGPTQNYSQVLSSVPPLVNLADWNRDKAAAMGTDMGTGGILGFATGFATKKAGKVALLVAGTGIASLQYLSSKGLVQVDWLAVDRTAKRYLDLNNDGKIDIADAEIALTEANSYMARGMPFAGGFGAGFLAGLRSG